MYTLDMDRPYSRTNMSILIYDGWRHIWYYDHRVQDKDQYISCLSKFCWKDIRCSLYIQAYNEYGHPHSIHLNNDMNRRFQILYKLH